MNENDAARCTVAREEWVRVRGCGSIKEDVNQPSE